MSKNITQYKIITLKLTIMYSIITLFQFIGPLFKAFKRLFIVKVPKTVRISVGKVGFEGPFTFLYRMQNSKRELEIICKGISGLPQSVWEVNGPFSIPNLEYGSIIYTLIITEVGDRNLIPELLIQVVKKQLRD